MRATLPRSAVLLSAVVLSAPSLSAADRVDYVRDVKPLLAAKCGACHGALKQQAGLRVDVGRLVRKGSDDGPVIVPGQAAASRLIERVAARDPAERMPPEGEGEPLDAAQVALLRSWIDAGAPSPEDEVVPEDPRRHWAYRIPQRPPVPQPRDARWRGPIDAFVARQHEAHGLTPVEPADRRTLLRRAYFDLIGLPPTEAQVESFLNDPSPDVWRNAVDSLLASPHHGERWGRHWMDVWRYSDWDGYKDDLRSSQRHIWRWRDWIVESLNADKGYDRMVVEMLAGDEIAPHDPRVLAATGFLARNHHKSNRDIWLDATVEHTAKAFLGTTLDCARCHDHKFDPVPQTAYYRFRAIFEPHRVRTDRVPGVADLLQDGLPRAFDADLAAPTHLYVRGDEKRPDKEHPLSPGVPDVLGGAFAVQPVDLPVEAYYPALFGFVVEEELAALRKRRTEAEAALATADAKPRGEGDDEPARTAQRKPLELRLTVAEAQLKSFEARRAADAAKYVAGSDGGADRVQQLASTAAQLERSLRVAESELGVETKRAALATAEAGGEADAKKKQAAVEKARKELAEADKTLETARSELAKTDAKYTPLGTEHPRTSTGRRLALARWIASPDNPLTARVAANQIWMRHFGEPLVANVFDFGLRSPRPVHAELLDWLACELVEHGWSLKHLHRLIVASRTWQLASSAPVAVTERNRKIDPDNRLLWRANVRRLDAEVVRDNVLAVTGRLDPQLGGADIDFRLGEESRRRSLYLRHAYEKQMTMLVLFDAASPEECYRRSESIVPQQALALTNSALVQDGSRLLARRLAEEVDTARDGADARFVDRAFLRILSRPPDDRERTACLRFLVEQSRALSDPAKLAVFAGGAAPQVAPAKDAAARAREGLVHVLLNHNDFITVR